MNILAWVRQPTTIAGLSTIAGTAVAVLSGSTTWQGALPLIAGGIVAMVLPDNTAARQAVQTFVVDAVKAETVVVHGGGGGPGGTNSPAFVSVEH